MKRSVIALLIILVLCLAACGQPPRPTEPAPPAAEPIVTQPTDPPTEAPTVMQTEPAHTALYIPGLAVEDVILYFNEVCLDAEVINGGDPSRLQKWTTPIIYHVYGDPTSADLTVLDDFTAWLNTIDGFPGIRGTDDPAAANLRIHFCGPQALLDIMGSNFTGLDGAVTFWYDHDEIYDAVICVRTDLEQHLRSSVILEEIYNGLGPIQDTALRADSIIYSEYSEPQELTETDALILKLLYHPRMQCGMNTAECEAVIRQLYN